MIIEVIFFYFSLKPICCDPSSEPSGRDGSDDGSQYMFYTKLTKIVPNYHQIPTLLSKALNRNC